MALIGAFELEGQIVRPRLSERERQRIATALDSMEALDAQRKGWARLEQGQLRDALFANVSETQCCLCGRKLPIELLVAAHVKRRASCSGGEKRDLRNIVPMCVLGCDDLFERGFLGVRNGVVVGDDRRLGTITDETAQRYVRQAIGRECGVWTEKTQPYFEWHLAYHQLGPAGA